MSQAHFVQYALQRLLNNLKYDSTNALLITDRGGVVQARYDKGMRYSQAGLGALVTNAINYKPPAVAGTYRVSVVVDVESAAASNMAVTVTYRNSATNTRSFTMQLSQQGATTVVVNMNNTVAVFTGSLVFAVDNSATNITVSTTGTTQTTYDMAITLEQLN